MWCKYNLKETKEHFFYPMQVHFLLLGVWITKYGTHHWFGRFLIQKQKTLSLNNLNTGTERGHKVIACI